MSKHIVAGRDPVCLSIEALLRDLESDGKGPLERSDVKDAVCLTFGSLRVEAETYDIALVRLASAMTDDARYCEVLMGALRGPMRAQT